MSVLGKRSRIYVAAFARTRAGQLIARTLARCGYQLRHLHRFQTTFRRGNRQF